MKLFEVLQCDKKGTPVSLTAGELGERIMGMEQGETITIRRKG